LAYTIYLAKGAKTAAIAAEDASKAAKSRMTAVDWSLQFRDLFADVDSLRSLVEINANWRHISAESTRIRGRAAVANKFHFVPVDEETRKNLRESATQFANIAKIADQHATNAITEKQVLQIRKLLAEQRVLFEICFEHVKSDASGGQNV
jgi:hypothetical protein